MKSSIKIILTAFIFSMLFSCAEDNQPADSGPNFGDAPVNPDQTLLLSLVNEVRTNGCKCGSTDMPPVGEVTWNNLLETAAKNHSQYMDTEDDLTHLSSDGTSADSRIEEEGYNLVEGSWAENLAKGFADEQSVFDGWKDSEPHCKNIMKAGATEMGIGTSGAFWTMLLANQH